MASTVIAVAVQERLGHNDSSRRHARIRIQGRQPQRALLDRRNAGARSSSRRSWWQGTGASIVIHALILGALIYAATHATQIVQTGQPGHREARLHLPRPAQAGPGRRWRRTPEGSRAAAKGRDRRREAAGRAARRRSRSTSPTPHGHRSDPDPAGRRDAARHAEPRSTRPSAPAPAAAAAAPASAPAPVRASARAAAADSAAASTRSATASRRRCSSEK